MERKLDLKDIAGYLPYGLAILNGNESDKIIGYEVKDEDEHKGEYVQIFSLFRGGLQNYTEIKNITPVLRPLSDLYRTITHSGKEIVPIVEIACIAFPALGWIPFKNDPDDRQEEWKCKHAGYDIEGNSTYINVDFTYKNGAFFAYEVGEIIKVEDQYLQFDYLNELKIDYRGLLDAGLAIDANTLESNPYK